MILWQGIWSDEGVFWLNIHLWPKAGTMMMTCNRIEYSGSCCNCGILQSISLWPCLTPGIRICSPKWSQVNISIEYRYISQGKILYNVRSLKLKFCQSDCRFKILAFFLWKFYLKDSQNVFYQSKKANLRQKSNFTLFSALFWCCSPWNFKNKKTLSFTSLL